MKITVAPRRGGYKLIIGLAIGVSLLLFIMGKQESDEARDRAVRRAAEKSEAHAFVVEHWFRCGSFTLAADCYAAMRKAAEPRGSEFVRQVNDVLQPAEDQARLSTTTREDQNTYIVLVLFMAAVVFLGPKVDNRPVERRTTRGTLALAFVPSLTLWAVAAHLVSLGDRRVSGSLWVIGLLLAMVMPFLAVAIPELLHARMRQREKQTQST